MEILRFTLSGKNAFFKKPEVNSYYYYTFGNIHKVALLGIFGAILGYGGYTQMQDFAKKKKKKELTESYPEFYQRLKEVKISILPMTKRGLIPKKVQSFNNSVGYASKELGGNLIVKEQWLENPKWEICVLIDGEEAEKIKTAICGGTCTYIPYLGKNDHFADIQEISIENVEKCDFEMGRINCFAPKSVVEMADLDSEEEEELGAYSEFKYEEALPIGMDGWVNQYIMENYIYTDAFLTIKGCDVYQLSDSKKILFY